MRIKDSNNWLSHSKKQLQKPNSSRLNLTNSRLIPIFFELVVLIETRSTFGLRHFSFYWCQKKSAEKMSMNTHSTMKPLPLSWVLSTMFIFRRLVVRNLVLFCDSKSKQKLNLQCSYIICTATNGPFTCTLHSGVHCTRPHSISVLYTSSNANSEFLMQFWTKLTRTQ